VAGYSVSRLALVATTIRLDGVKTMSSGLESGPASVPATMVIGNADDTATSF